MWTNLYIWVQWCGKMCRQRMRTECTKQRYKNKNDKRNDRDKEWENRITKKKNDWKESKKLKWGELKQHTSCISTYIYDNVCDYSVHDGHSCAYA